MTVSLTFPEGTEDAEEKLVMPGDSVVLEGTLVHELPLLVSDRVTVREGGKTVGTGVITKIL